MGVSRMFWERERDSRGGMSGIRRSICAEVKSVFTSERCVRLKFICERKESEMGVDWTWIRGGDDARISDSERMRCDEV